MSDFIIKNDKKLMRCESNMDLFIGAGVMVNDQSNKYYGREFIVSGKKLNGRNGWEGDSCFTFSDTDITLPLNTSFLLWDWLCA